MFKIIKVEGFSTPRKVIITENNVPIICCDSTITAGKIISYLEGNDNADLPDNYKRKLNKYNKKLRKVV